MIEGCFCVASAVALEGPQCVFEPCRRFGGVEKRTIVEWSMLTAEVACDFGNELQRPLPHDVRQ
jgi:hypothetical protein